MGLKQLEPSIEEIGGYTFYITPFPALKAANLSGDLVGFFTPYVGVVASVIGAVDTKNILDLDIAEAGEMIGKALMQCPELTGEKVEWLVRKLLLQNNIVVETYNDNTGKTDAIRLDIDTLNEVFCGEIQDMYILCYKVIQINYKGFFSKISGRFGNVLQAGEKILGSKTTEDSTRPTLMISN